jgi:Arc/MetJ-type ribon-helix-helix transcriptional regulator
LFKAVASLSGITYCHTMATVKVAITIDGTLLKRVDSLVGRRVFPNRSKAIGDAVREKLDRFDRTRLARECAKLDPKEERALADEGLARDLKEWPAY